MAVTDDGVAHVSAGCLELQVVKIDECTDLTDAAVAFFTNFDLTNRLKEVWQAGKHAGIQITGLHNRACGTGAVQGRNQALVRHLFPTNQARLSP